MLKKILFLCVGSIFTILAVSCSKTKENSPSRYLHINLPGEPSTLDPRKGGDIYSSALHFLLFEGLTKVSENSSADYGIADHILLSDDKTTYTFHLRDALWSDQSKITAYDFEFSWKSMLDPSFSCPNANLLYPILNAEEAKKGLVSLEDIGIHAIDEKTLVITLKQPTPYFLNLISFCVFFPVSHKTVMQNNAWADSLTENFISNGPYRLAKWKHNNEFVLEKNPYYWDVKNVSLEGVNISLVTDENTALEMFNRGELDVLGSPYTNILLDAAETLKQSGALKSFPVGKTYITAFNTQHEIFKNKHIRKAFSLSIDREALVANVGFINEIPALNFVPPVLKDGKNIPLIKSMDIAAAKWHLQQGLQELNLQPEDLNKLHLIYAKQDLSHKISQILQEQWSKNLGINLELEALDMKSFLTRVNAHDFELCQYYWAAQYDDPMNILDRFKYATNPKNYPHWESATYAQLLDVSATLSGIERSNILQQAEELIMEETPLTPLFHGSVIQMTQPYIEGIYNSSIGSVHIHKIRFTKKKD